MANGEKKIVVDGEESVDDEIVVDGEESVDDEIVVDGEESVDDKIVVDGEESVDDEIVVDGEESVDDEIVVDGEESVDDKIVVDGEESVDDEIVVDKRKEELKTPWQRLKEQKEAAKPPKTSTRSTSPSKDSKEGKAKVSGSPKSGPSKKPERDDDPVVERPERRERRRARTPEANKPKSWRNVPKIVRTRIDVLLVLGHSTNDVVEKVMTEFDEAQRGGADREVITALVEQKWSSAAGAKATPEQKRDAIVREQFPNEDPRRPGVSTVTTSPSPAPRPSPARISPPVASTNSNWKRWVFWGVIILLVVYVFPEVLGFKHYIRSFLNLD